MLRSQLKRIRGHPYLRDALIIVFIESNMGYINTDQVNDYITELLNKDKSLGPIHVDNSFDPLQSGRYGVYTSPAEKERYQLAMCEAFKNQTVCFADDMICPFEADAGDPVEANDAIRVMRQELFDQLQVYREETKEPSDIFGKTKKVITGKGHKRPDDLAMCLQMVIFWAAKLMEVPTMRQMLLNLALR